jgi:hypothetical protein
MLQMRSKLRRILWGSIVMVVMASWFVSCGKDNPTEIIDDDGDQTIVEDEFPVDENKVFRHPGLLHTQADFDRVIAKVESQSSPWAEGWEKLTNNSHAQLTYNPAPVVKLVRGGSSAEEPDPDNYSRAMNDVAAAYQCAIRWKVTGDEAYADKAVEILNAWAEVCERISGNTNTALAAGIYGYQFANAGEIMRDYQGWAEADFQKYQQWMLDVFYATSSAFLETHWGTCNTHYWANWDLCNIACIMSVGVLCDSVDLYKDAIDYLIDGLGNGNLHKCINYIHPKSTNDDIDLGQIQESGRDQGHTLMDIGLLGTICQMAYNQGEDLFAYDDNLVLKGAEYAAKYNFANLQVPFTEYTRVYTDAWSQCGGREVHTQISSSGKAGERPIWELIYNHYVVKEGIKARYVTLAAQRHRPEGGGGDYGSTSGGFDQLGLGTLMYSLE